MRKHSVLGSAGGAMLVFLCGCDSSVLLSVRLHGDGKGTVMVGSHEVCANDCSLSFAAGTAVDLVASADPGSRFSGWNEGCTGTQHCSVQLKTDLRVIATFARGEACPPGARAPGPPRDFVPEAGIRAARIRWTPPADDGGCPIDHYRVRISKENNVAWELSTPAASLEVQGFDNGYFACFSVSAVNPVGEGPISRRFSTDTLSGCVDIPDVPLEPENVIAYPSSGSADVYWTPPSPGKMLNQPLHSIYPITNYRVVASPGNMSITTPDASPLSGTSTLHAFFPGLQDGVTYTFTVVAHSDVGDSAPARPSNAITPPVSIWKPGPRLSFEWFGFSGTAAAGESLFVLGTAFASRLVPDGSPGPWNAIEGFDARRFFSSSVFNADDQHSYVHVVGGLGHADEVLVSAVKADGTLSAWVSAGPRLPIARAAHASAVYKNFLYVVGGTGSPLVSDVSFAALRPEGSYSEWTATTPLPFGRDWLLTLVYKNFLYAIGGSDTRDVLVATLGEDGFIQGPWRRTSAQLPAPRSTAGGAVVGDRVYVVGGSPLLGGEAANSVFIGQLDPTTGDIASWDASESDAFFGRRDTLGVAFAAGTLYVVGGMGDDKIPLADVQFARIDPATGHLER